MSGSTQIQPFATGVGANVLDPTDYAALSSTTQGYSAGIANSQYLNTTFRQSAFMASALANFLVSQGLTQNDDGDLAGAVTNIQQAIKQLVGAPNVFTGGTTTGTANAQVLATVVPASGFALNNGYSVIATADFTNTGSTTMNIASSGPLTVQKLSGASLVNLTGGEIVATDNFSIIYNSTANVWVLQTTPTLGALAYLGFGYGTGPDGAGNIEVLATSTPKKSGAKDVTSGGSTSTTAASLTASEMVLENSASQTVKVSNVSVAFNTAASVGAITGLDTGSLAGSTWYYGYVIYNPTTMTTSCIFSLSATAPALPSGYTYCSNAVTAFKLDGSTNIIGYSQNANLLQFKVGSNLAGLPQISSGTLGSVGSVWAAQTVRGSTSLVPAAAGSIIGMLVSTSGVQNDIYMAPNSNYGGITSTNPPPYIMQSNGFATQNSVPFDFILESNSVSIQSLANTGSYVLGFRI